MRKVLALAVAITAGSAAARAADPGVADDTLLIGMEGPANSFSTDEENLGMHLAIRAANDRGGVQGRKLVVRSHPRSGGAAIAEAVANAKRLVQDDGIFLIYNFGGPAAIEVAKYATESKVPYLFPHTALVTTDAAHYVFTSYPRYQGESEVMFRYLSERRNLKKIAIVHDANVYGQFFLDRLKEFAGPFGYTVTGNLPLTLREPGDLAEGMARLREGAPDAVVLALYPAQAKSAMEAKVKLDWKAVRMISVGPLTDEQYINVPGGFAEGTLGFCYYPDPNHSDVPGVVEYRQTMAKYFAGHELNRYSLYGYTFGKLIIEGLQRAGRNVTRENFIAAMETITEWDSGGVMPPVTLSSSNHHAQRAGFICELKEARFQPLSDWIAP